MSAVALSQCIGTRGLGSTTEDAVASVFIHNHLSFFSLSDFSTTTSLVMTLGLSSVFSLFFSLFLGRIQVGTTFPAESASWNNSPTALLSTLIQKYFDGVRTCQKLLFLITIIIRSNLEGKMKQRTCCFLIVAIQIISWLHVSTVSSASHDHIAPQQVPEFPGVAFDSKQGVEETKGRRKLGRIGSTPPNCQRKCSGCTPCIATQIPTTSDMIGTQYTNYEPEGWTCKCHSTFFNP
ncbi:Diacylglycerol acyltransferase [Hibiscus syriacus]|uniref:Epidermal patterning factor-like protein n=1 Tax=Hibiscus syriacus TaxID=106335 RepID=A0A6A3D0J8_HIBSY|nr:Diacylglycerol acyltransferase [Hibiscus syriacus]